MPTYTFRDFLLEEMKLRDMSARQFAKFIGVNPSTVTRAIDAREPKAPGLEFLMATARATKRSLLSLVQLAYPEEVERSRASVSAQILAQQIDELPEHEKDIILRLVRRRCE